MRALGAEVARHDPDAVALQEVMSRFVGSLSAPFGECVVNYKHRQCGVFAAGLVFESQALYFFIFFIF